MQEKTKQPSRRKAEGNKAAKARKPYTKPQIESCEVFESFSLFSCASAPFECVVAPQT